MQNEKEPMLSVVVFSYNHKEYIDTCLESIFRQKTDFIYEILIADDASPDGTAQMVREKYGDRVRVLERKENLGLCRNMYDAFMQARGKYIYECSGDDYLSTEYVFQKLAGYLEEHEDIFSVTGWNEMYDVAKGTKKTVEQPYTEFTFLDLLRGKKIYFFIGMMRNTFKQDQPQYLCKGSRNNEEVQMWYYTLLKSKKIILPERLYTYCYRTNGGSGTYNARQDFLRMLGDYAQGFRAVEKITQDKYKFDVAKITYYSSCIDYYIQNNGLKSAFKLLKVLRPGELASFAWIKFLMKLNHREMPAFLLREERLIR